MISNPERRALGDAAINRALSLQRDLPEVHLAYAKEASISEAERAVEMLPISKDALIGFAIVTNLAVAHAWNDELDQAFGTLSPLAKIPYGIYFGQLKLDPYWEPLRKDPR